MKELAGHARLMCTTSDLNTADKMKVFYIDTDNEKIAIEDDSDLQMAYALALTSDNKVKFMIESNNSKVSLKPSVFNSPIS